MNMRKHIGLQPQRIVCVATLALAVLGDIEAQSPALTTLEVAGRSNATPWVAASGSFVAVAWGASTGDKTDVFVAVSRDGGSSFGTPVRVNRVDGEARLRGEMPPRVALASKKGATAPEVVVLWAASQGTAAEIKTARSRDGGLTFELPVVLQAAGAPGNRGWAAVALDDQGAAHAIWLDHRRHAADRSEGAAAHVHQHGPAPAHDGFAMAQQSGLYYASTGSAPVRERELTNGVCYCCKTALATGPNGSVFAAWRHVYPGSVRDMAFTVSRDRGRSFSPPVRVSDDGWAINGCPEDGPSMSVDARGTVHVVWPTLISGPNPEGALFYASTRDGRTFTRRVRVPTLGSPKPSHPQLVSDRAGRLLVAWDEVVKGQRVSAVREVKVGGATPSFGPIVTLAPQGPAMYPGIAASDRGLVAVWTTGSEPSRVVARLVQIP
jgi:hypothetical protein